LWTSRSSVGDEYPVVNPREVDAPPRSRCVRRGGHHGQVSGHWFVGWFGSGTSSSTRRSCSVMRSACLLGPWRAMTA